MRIEWGVAAPQFSCSTFTPKNCRRCARPKPISDPITSNAIDHSESRIISYPCGEGISNRKGISTHTAIADGIAVNAPPFVRFKALASSLAERC